MVQAVSEIDNFTTVYDNQIEPLLTCEYAINSVNTFKDILCTPFYDSIYFLAVSSLVIGVFLIPDIFLLVVGFKRFTIMKTM